MSEVLNVGETILLDGQPLTLVTSTGIKRWSEGGIKYTHRYDQVRDPLDGQMKYRCLYEKDGADVLVNDPDSVDGRVVLFDAKLDHAI